MKNIKNLCALQNWNYKNEENLIKLCYNVWFTEFDGSNEADDVLEALTALNQQQQIKDVWIETC